MIHFEHFDTNALIALPLRSRSRHPVVARVVAGEAAAACAVVWYEFLAGPLVESEAKMARAFLRGRIVSVDERDAELAAQLFNAAGRNRCADRRHRDSGRGGVRDHQQR